VEKRAIISDFKRTRNIVLDELHVLQSNRSRLIGDIQKFESDRNDLNTELENLGYEKNALLRGIEVLKQDQERIKNQRVKEIIPIAGRVAPADHFLKIQNEPIEQNSKQFINLPQSSSLFQKTFNENFDYSRCPIFGEFITSGDNACVFLQNNKISSNNFKNSNFIVFKKYLEPSSLLNTAAVRSSPDFKLSDSFRQNYDMVIPDNFDDYYDQDSTESSKIPISEIQTPPIPFSPANRKNLLAFCNNPDFIEKSEKEFIQNEFLSSKKLKILEPNSVSSDGKISSKNNMLFATHTFMLIPAYSGYTSSTGFTKCLRLSLLHGTIPVILKLNNNYNLPFDEFVDYKKTTLTIPFQRHPELTEILNKIHPQDIHKLRRTGFFQYSTYYQNSKIIKSIILNVIRQRLNIPQTPVSVKELKGNVVPHAKVQLPPGFPHLKVYNLDKEILEELENVPRESKRDSLIDYRNHSSQFLDVERIWNEVPGPAMYFGSTPFEPDIPTELRKTNTEDQFSIVGEGEGGYGEEFQKDLGGNRRREQFTIVMLTYDRNEVLIESLKRLDQLPFLNKVLVIWNNPEYPGEELQWPDIGVEIVVIKTKRNSLNNRFFPYAEIETDAILHLDDDAHLRQDEILFAFRIWREETHSIVGFPGRFHAISPDQSPDPSKPPDYPNLLKWNYNSNYTCELSMVLTGAAFVHKWYMHLYQFWMPVEIRDIVDEFINCEDLALNYLISHVTRAPPVKVTSRWTFRCPNCPTALSSDQSHFNERHECMNRFSKIYGYNPLLMTQRRADSILFKTRLPSSMSKCYKFI
jgi:hypothetical protein